MGEVDHHLVDDLGLATVRVMGVTTVSCGQRPMNDVS
jgi:hypothetical protein